MFSLRRTTAILLILLFLAQIILVPAASALDSGPKYRPIVPRTLATAIHKKFISLMDRFAASLSKKPGCRMEITMRMLDDRNRCLVAFRGVHTLPWPLPEDKFPDFQIATNGDIILDLYAERGKSKDGKAAWRYEGDVVILLDSLVLHLAKSVTQVAASFAIDYVATHLIDFLASADVPRLVEATRRGVTDLASVSAGQGAESTIRRMILFQDQQPLISTLVKYVKNGNLISFLCYEVIAIATTQGLKLAASSVGALVGTAVAPGAGTIIGALVARAGTLIIVDFIINKVVKEWYLKLQINRLLRLHAKGIPAGSVQLDKYRRTQVSISEKIIDQVKREQFDRLDVLLKEIKDLDARRLPALGGVIKDIVKCMQHMVLQDKNWLPARKYYQLRQLLIDKKIDVTKYGY